MAKKMNSREVCRRRVVIAAWLRNRGESFASIAQVMRGTPNEARNWVAKAAKRDLL